ncbi:MAG: Spy/CpxP family protein refolding chaperone [Chitinophagaceae bacterium]
MKKIMLSVFVAALVVTTSQAQETEDRKPGKHQMMRKHHRGEEFKNLNLTEDQKVKFKTLNEENRKKMSELKKNDNITMKEWRSKMDAQRKEHRAKVQNLLTDEQKAQLEKSRQERNAEFSEKSKVRMEKMKTDLGLSDEQYGKLKSNREAMAEKMKALWEDKSLNDESKKDQVIELRKKQKEDMKSILTEEQLKKFEEQKHQRSSHKKIK